MRNPPGSEAHFGGLGGGAWGDHYESDSYRANTAVHRLRQADPPTARRPITLGEYLDLCWTDPQGSPAWQAWVLRASLRRQQ